MLQKGIAKEHFLFVFELLEDEVVEILQKEQKDKIYRKQQGTKRKRKD